MKKIATIFGIAAVSATIASITTKIITKSEQTKERAMKNSPALDKVINLDDSKYEHENVMMADFQPTSGFDKSKKTNKKKGYVSYAKPPVTETDPNMDAFEQQLRQAMKR